jgi:hypothetical protein
MLTQMCTKHLPSPSAKCIAAIHSEAIAKLIKSLRNLFLISQEFAW